MSNYINLKTIMQIWKSTDRPAIINRIGINFVIDFSLQQTMSHAVRFISLNLVLKLSKSPNCHSVNVILRHMPTHQFFEQKWRFWVIFQTTTMLAKINPFTSYTFSCYKKLSNCHCNKRARMAIVASHKKAENHSKRFLSRRRFTLFRNYYLQYFQIYWKSKLDLHDLKNTRR